MDWATTSGSDSKSEITKFWGDLVTSYEEGKKWLDILSLDDRNSLDYTIPVLAFEILKHHWLMFTVYLNLIWSPNFGTGSES